MCDSMPLYVGRRGELFVTRAADWDNAMHHGAMMERRSISSRSRSAGHRHFSFRVSFFGMRCDAKLAREALYM